MHQVYFHETDNFTYEADIHIGTFSSLKKALQAIATVIARQYRDPRMQDVKNFEVKETDVNAILEDHLPKL